MIKQNELKVGMRVIGTASSRTYSGFVGSVTNNFAYIIRDDNYNGGGNMFRTYKTWIVKCNNGFWYSDGMEGEPLRIDKRYDPFMLNIKKFNKIKHNEIFKSGICLIEHPWFNQCKKISQGGCLEEDGRHTKVKYVALKSVDTWAIFHSLDANFIAENYLDDIKHLNIDERMIANHGTKLYDSTLIKELINCDEDVFALYRK